MTDPCVEAVARAIEEHFTTRFGAEIQSDGPSHLVRCMDDTAFNPVNVATAAIAAMHSSRPVVEGGLEMMIDNLVSAAWREGPQSIADLEAAKSAIRQALTVSPEKPA